MGQGSYYGDAVGSILTGQDTAVGTVPKQLGFDVICRRVLLVAAAGDTVYVVSQGQPVGTGFPIPQIQADGNHRYLELWVNGLDVIWIVGTASDDVVYWLAEEV